MYRNRPTELQHDRDSALGEQLLDPTQRAGAELVTQGARVGEAAEALVFAFQVSWSSRSRRLGEDGTRKCSRRVVDSFVLPGLPWLQEDV